MSTSPRNSMISDDLSPTSEKGFKICMALVFAGVAFVMRFAPMPENFACFGALSIFCGFVLTGPLRWAIPIGSFFVADCLGHAFGAHGMGFYHVPSMIFNYLGFAAMVLVGWQADRFLSTRSSQWMPWAGVTSASLVASIAFFLLSNFGSWLDPMMGYERTMSGLIQCYLLGLPFFQTTLISDMLFAVGFYGVYRVALGAFVANHQVAR